MKRPRLGKRPLMYPPKPNPEAEGSGASPCSLSLSDLATITEALKAGLACAAACSLNTTYHEGVMRKAEAILSANTTAQTPPDSGTKNL